MARVKVQFNQKKVIRKVSDANFRNIGQASATLRTIARRSIRFRKRRDKPSVKGTPPVTHDRTLRNSILFVVSKAKNESIIGADSSRIGKKAAKAQEHGGIFDGQRFDARPFMAPALEKIRPRLPRMWAGSVKA